MAGEGGAQPLTVSPAQVTCLAITQVHTAYCHIMGVFGIFLLFSQIDFLLVRMFADLLVNHYTTMKFMDGKRVDPEGAYRAGGGSLALPAACA